MDALRRRTRAMQGRCQGFNCHAALARMIERESRLIDKDLSRTAAKINPGGPAAPHDSKGADVLIVGGGPAGLSAALELKRLGVDNIFVAEREPEAGGIPRLCGHTGFGLRDFNRVMSGPSYARKYREIAEGAGIRIHTSTAITNWEDQHRVSFTSPDGTGIINASSILLATGVRERPRAARLVPGDRPQGVFTTGSLQRFVYEHHLPVGKRAVVIGAETVSLSAVLTLTHAHVRVLNMITELPKHQYYLPIFLPAKILYADILAGATILTSKRVTNILGHERVEAVEITDLDSGHAQIIECDTVVFSGDWIPENEFARKGEVETGQPSLGPQIDSWFRTSQPGIFAAGNLLRGVETADWAALEGRKAARSIARFLKNGQWPANRLRVLTEAPFAWICPNAIAPDSAIALFRFRSNEFRTNVRLQLTQGERVLYQKTLHRLMANTSINLTGDWVRQVDFAGESLKLAIHS
jgi:thioredoxin reductase